MFFMVRAVPWESGTISSVVEPVLRLNSRFGRIRSAARASNQRALGSRLLLVMRRACGVVVHGWCRG